MTRLVKKTAKGPKEVEGKWICMCGLSKDQPFCDGSHKKTHSEKEGKTYVYTKKGERKEIQLEERPLENHSH